MKTLLIIAVIYTSNCEIKAWKIFRPQRDSYPWPLRYSLLGVWKCGQTTLTPPSSKKNLCEQMHSFRSICESVHDNGRKNLKKAKNSYQQEDCISGVQRSVCLHHSPHVPWSRQFHVVSVHSTEARRIKEADWSSRCWTVHVFYRSRARSLERYDCFASKCCSTMAHAYMRW